jgi:hypothetical protein
MVCPSCGKAVAGTEAQCKFCGADVGGGDTIPTVSKDRSRQRRDATTCLLLGLLSFATLPAAFAIVYCELRQPDALGAALLVAGFLIAVPTGVLALVYGRRANQAIRRMEGRISGDERATPGIILGAVGVGIWFLPILFLPFAPTLFHPLVGDGSPGVGSLRVIDQAAAAYSCAYAHGYPPTLASLGPPKSNWFHTPPASEEASGFITDKLASGLTSGYRITYAAGPVDRDGKIQTYTARADPIGADTETLHYFTDQSGVIRASHKDPDTNSDPVAGPENLDCTSGNFRGLQRPFSTSPQADSSK